MKLQVATQLQDTLRPVVADLLRNQIASRIAQKDSNIWGPEAQPEASIRLGWTGSAKDSVALVSEILKLRDQFRSQGINRIVLCGMGGSSLAPEVIAKNSGIELVVLDSTEPSQVAAALVELDRTAVVVSSKSGSTVETDSQKRAFEFAFKEAGIDPLSRIVIVTDPGSPLDKASRESGFKVFNADPNVGGRYSALTAFGMVPSGLAGADVLELLSSAAAVSLILEADSEENPALWLAAALTRIPAGSSFKDKFLIESDDLPGFGDWVEQLVAESTGKNQRGTLPVVITSSAPEISFKPLDTLHTRFGANLGSADVAFEGSLGELFLLWEYATAAAGWILGIDPFNQPNVESAKIAARALLDSPISSQETDFVDRGISVVAKGFKLEGSTVEAALQQLLALANEDSYISVHAYLNRIALPQFEQLRDLLANKTRRPTTFGWGPRFLHSTGQYHKGGPRQGVFLQLVQKSDFDLAVPDRPFTFGTLIGGQAAGDANVIEANGLPVLTLILTNPIADLELIKKVIG